MPRTWEMRSEPAKIGAVLGVGILAMLLGLLMASLGDRGLGLAVFVLLLFGGIYALTRIFRGPSERVGERRAWWRLTANPATGYVWAVLFVARAVWVGLVHGIADPEGVITVTLFLVPAIAFLGSSVRLAASRRAATS